MENKYQNCVIIPPGNYSRVKFDSDKCYVCIGTLRLYACKFDSKLFIIGNLIANQSVFHSLDVNEKVVLKNSVCKEDLFAFSGGNFFNSNMKRLITHGSVYVKEIKSDMLQIHGAFKSKGDLIVKSLTVYS